MLNSNNIMWNTPMHFYYCSFPYFLLYFYAHCSSISTSLTMSKSLEFSPWEFGNFKKLNKQWKLGSCHVELWTATLRLQMWGKLTDSWIISFITFQSYIWRNILISASHVNILWTQRIFCNPKPVFLTFFVMLYIFVHLKFASS